MKQFCQYDWNLIRCLSVSLNHSLSLSLSLCVCVCVCLSVVKLGACFYPTPLTLDQVENVINIFTRITLSISN
jgi:hypothetical protein